MNQLINEFFVSFRNSYRISVKNGGISTLYRYQPKANSRSWTSVQHDSSRSRPKLWTTFQTSSFLSRDYLTHSGTLNETKKFLLNGSLTSSLFRKHSFRNETRTFLTLLTGTVLDEGQFNKHALKRFRHRSVKTGDSSKEKREEIDPENEEDESDEEEEDDDGDLSHLTFPEDKTFPDNYREIKVHLKSLRLDAIVSAGLNTARSQVDNYFLESKLKFNGERVLKKSKQMRIGDFVDLIMPSVDGKTRVKRVRILKVDENKTAKDKLKVTLRAWRTSVPVDNTDG